MGTLLLGEIESSLLQGYFGELRTKEVVVTEERMEHIRERHPEDVELFVLYGKETVLKPDILLVDEKHIGTASPGDESEYRRKAGDGNRPARPQELCRDLLPHPGAQPEKADGEESAALQPGIIVV